MELFKIKGCKEKIQLQTPTTKYPKNYKVVNF
nr:MAG TPA: hypothetical protein [Caudoviricetes sp.]DAS60156.1 MAG TPA: hypothetical protein [Caudoviricetes sp.]